MTVNCTTDGAYFMPAEWEEHECTWMVWPTNSQSKHTWTVPKLSPVRRNFAEVAAAIAHFEPVRILVDNAKEMDDAKAFFARCSGDTNISFELCPVDDVWVRDTGPTFCVNQSRSELLAISWIFNCWGEKLKPGEGPGYAKDAALANRIADCAGLSPCQVVDSCLTIEGGNIHSDGEGTLLVAASSVINNNRNRGWSKDAIEEELKRQLGVQVVIWLPGLSKSIDPITDGHVDGIACWVRPGVVLFGGSSPSIGDRATRRLTKQEKKYYAEMSANRAALESAVDARGRSLEIYDMPESESALQLELSRRCGAQFFCNSYINFYLTNNDGLVAPSYGVEADDDRARRIFESAFPDRRVVLVDITAIACGGGGIHCITQQQPKVWTVEDKDVT